ncbi:hypothetical protein NDU88_003213 [Pleurodeles waltl]|uniref:Gag protein n=1 Tax=Pleurodeles waltl TaxID=8319 RepID=A0AAV7Q955_PLEWA|nr:hypothetical protein NDU88_003213 [Pleurodeles waltl]
MNTVPPIEPFIVEGAPSTQAARWNEWVERLMFYFEATKTDNAQKRAMVVHLGGKDIYRIAKTINEAEPKTHLTLIAALRTHFAPMVNVDYERLIFRQARQSADESIDMLYLRLKELAATCTFHNENDEIRGQIIQGCVSSKLRERILEESGRPLQDILTIGRTKELSKARVSHMEAALQSPIKMEQVAAVIGASSKPKTQKTLPSTKTCGSVSPGHGPLTTEMDEAEEDEELEHRLSDPAPENMESVCDRQDNDSDTNPRDPVSRGGRDLRSGYHLRSNPALSTMLRDFLV